MKYIAWLGSVSCMLPLTVHYGIRWVHLIRYSNSHFTLEQPYKMVYSLQQEGLKLCWRVKTVAWINCCWGWWSCGKHRNRQHKWYVPSCCHGLFPLYHNALHSVVVVYACSPHRDEFSCNWWGEERLILWVTGSFDLTLMQSISIKCLTAFFIRAHAGYCEVQKGLEADEILQNNWLSVSHSILEAS